jgi:hypothetical protein
MDRGAWHSGAALRPFRGFLNFGELTVIGPAPKRGEC